MNDNYLKDDETPRWASREECLSELEELVRSMAAKIGCRLEINRPKVQDH